MGNIHFISKEPRRDQLGCYRWPTYMVKNGKEYFVYDFESLTKYDAEYRWSCKSQLIDNDGMFFSFCEDRKSPYESLKEAIEKHCSFEKFGQMEVEWSDDGSFCDFYGVLEEFSAPFDFYYRIYDKNMVQNIEKIVGLIYQKKTVSYADYIPGMYYISPYEIEPEKELQQEMEPEEDGDFEIE